MRGSSRSGRDPATPRTWSTSSWWITSRRNTEEAPPEPGVALERRLLTRLALQEELPGRLRARAERLEHLALAARQAALRVRQLLEEPIERGGEEGQRRRVVLEQGGDRNRLGSRD